MIALRPRLRAALAAVPLLFLGATTPANAAPTPAPSPGYAALGDSYAAGVAARSYDPASGDCHRSSLAYPTLWAAAHSPSAFLDTACESATTDEVRTDQLPTVPSDTALVSVTVGGNDLDFSDAVIACLQPLTTDHHCTSALDHSARLLADDLPAHLDGLLTAIGQRAPGARVVLTGYPHLLESVANCWAGTTSRRDRFNALTDQLDDLVQRQATAHHARFADPRGDFAGHGLCAPRGSEWITGIVLSKPWESFHPTAEGQARGYLPAVARALAG
ncbi:SGNH/GDSL hydrolase family protein [Kitasatospora sp. NPDC052896]|uniref:SGNH/GDSL hydrolase family protein n=1 Tax=Kitasatospora sp. NPDC052896 TaxID=3364061 RepID=UPI0037C71723